MNRPAGARRFTAGETCQRTIDAGHGHGLPVALALPMCRVAGKLYEGTGLRSAGLFLDVIPETCAGQHPRTAGRVSNVSMVMRGADTHASGDTSQARA